MHTYTCIYWYQIFGHLDWHILYIPIPFRLSPDFPISMVHHLTNKHRTLSPPNPRWLLIKSSSNIGINGKKWEGTSAIHYTNISDTSIHKLLVSPGFPHRVLEQIGTSFSFCNSATRCRNSLFPRSTWQGVEDVEIPVVRDGQMKLWVHGCLKFI